MIQEILPKSDRLSVMDIIQFSGPGVQVNILGSYFFPFPGRGYRALLD